MEKYKIIICDDKKDKIDPVTLTLDDDIWEFIIVKSISELEIAISKHNDILALFLDLFFPVESSNDLVPELKRLEYEDILRIRRLIGFDTTLFIYTAYTNNVTDLINRLYSEGIVDDWFDKSDFLDKNLSIKTKVRINQKLNMDIIHNEGLWIIHFSDLHFGKEIELASSPISNYFSGMINRMIRTNTKEGNEFGLRCPNISVFSGDISQSSLETQFNEFKIFNEKLSEVLRKNSKKPPISIVAPGNHDFNFRASIIEEFEIDIKKEGPEIVESTVRDNLDEHRKYKIKNYLDLDNIINNPYISNNGSPYWWTYDLSKLYEVNLFVLNSSSNLTFKHKNVTINGKTIVEIRDNSKLDFNFMGILVVHHPTSLWNNEVERKQLLSLLYEDLNIKVILSGHKHCNDIKEITLDETKKMIEIQSGSATGKMEIQKGYSLPQFRIINISKSNGGVYDRVTSWTFSYDGESNYILKMKGTPSRPSESYEFK